jgi:hypothetical protein
MIVQRTHHRRWSRGFESKCSFDRERERERLREMVFGVTLPENTMAGGIAAPSSCGARPANPAHSRNRRISFTLNKQRLEKEFP